MSNRFRDRIAAVLLDSGTSGRPGGTGKKFDWRSVVSMTELMGRLDLRLIVAKCVKLQVHNRGRDSRFLSGFADSE
jgi:hypothetical protein